MENKGFGWDSLTKEAFRQSRLEFPIMKFTTHVDALKFYSERRCIFSGFYCLFETSSPQDMPKTNEGFSLNPSKDAAGR